MTLQNITDGLQTFGILANSVAVILLALALRRRDVRVGIDIQRSGSGPFEVLSPEQLMRAAEGHAALDSGQTPANPAKGVA